MWSWLNEHHIRAALAAVDQETWDVVTDALDAFIESPMESGVVDVQQLEGQQGRLDRWVAWLPRGFVLTYRPYVNGPPPHAGKHVVVLDMRTLAEPGADSATDEEE